MEALKYIVGGIACLILLYFLLKKLFNHVTVSDYEYLELISHVEWRAGRDIRKEMMRKKRGNISGPAFYGAMARLEDQDLIEGQYEIDEVLGQKIQRRQYKKKSGGIRKQNELHLKDHAVTGGMPIAT
jgi:hypothetical protein